MSAHMILQKLFHTPVTVRLCPDYYSSYKKNHGKSSTVPAETSSCALVELPFLIFYGPVLVLCVRSHMFAVNRETKCRVPKYKCTFMSFSSMNLIVLDHCNV